MKRSISVLLVALALVFAGCNGLLPGGDSTPTETVTPVAVPTDKPTSTPVSQLAPGLTRQGVTDVFALGEAHASVLGGTSFTAHRENTIRYSNGTVYRRFEIDGQLAATEPRYSITLNQSGAVLKGHRTSRQIWSDGERVLVAKYLVGNTSYRVPRDLTGEPIPLDGLPQRFLGVDLTSPQPIYTLFGVFETRVVDETTRNGTTLYEVAAVNVTRPDRLGTAVVSNPRNFSFRALISPEGLVREYRLRYTATLADQRNLSTNGETVTVRHTVRYIRLGNTTIERPPWYDDAIANVSTPTPTTASTTTPTTAA